MGGQAEKEKAKTKQEKLKDRVKREKKEKLKTKEAAAAAKTTPAGRADKVLATQRRLEERQRQQMILEEMKRPTEDMCLPDHQVVRGEQVLQGCPGRHLCSRRSLLDAQAVAFPRV